MLHQTLHGIHVPLHEGVFVDACGACAELVARLDETLVDDLHLFAADFGRHVIQHQRVTAAQQLLLASGLDCGHPGHFQADLHIQLAAIDRVIEHQLGLGGRQAQGRVVVAREVVDILAAFGVER